MKTRRSIFVACTAALTLAILAPSAGADVGVGAGTLAFDPAGAPTINNFTSVTLNGTPQLTSLTVDPFTIVDATGSALGWHVTLTVPDLVEAGSGDTIAASNVSMTAPVVTPAGASDMTGVAGHTSAGGFNAGETIVDAQVGDGLGTYLISPRILKLTVPVTARVGTYTSNATIAVTSGP